MLPFNEEFQTGESKITQIRLSVLLNNGTLLSLTEEHVMLGGLTRDSSTTVDGAFTVGAAVTGKLTVILDNSDQSLSEHDFRAAEITASLGGQLSDWNYELIQIGIYTVDEYTYDGSNITLTAYDNLHKFDLPCSESSVTFPRTITQLITQACSLAGVTLANTSIPNGSYSVTEQPESWDTMTWHDVVSYCAQIGCCFARILPDGKLFLSWYNVASLPGDQYDGGTFDTETTPYSDGAALDGGDFTYSETVDISGGEFGDRDDVTIIGSSFDLSVDTDDVLITGVTVTLAATNNIEATEGTADYEKTLGTSGYVIRVENNPLIETTANADAVCAFLYDYLVGMRFRPLSASIPENPALEAGDVALVVDRYNNTYTSFLSHVTYTTNSSTQISCDAESTMQNLKARYSETQKTRALAQRTFEKAITDAESAMQTIMSAVATTLGLNRFTESDGHGGTIYTYGNGTTLATSNIRWRFSAGALMVSSDYGRTWNGALTANGTAVLQEIYAVKVNADNILAGTITGRTISGGTITGTHISGAQIESNTTSGNSQAIMQYGTIRSTENSSNNTTLYSELTNGQFYTYVVQNNYQTSEINIANGRINIHRMYDWRDYSLTDDDALIDLNGYKHTGYETGKTPGLQFSISNYRTGGLCNCYMGGFLKNGIAGVGFYAPWIFGEGLTIFPSSKKSKVADTDYGLRELYCYETANPMYGDIGSATIGEDGTVIVDIDVIFAECISANAEYYVFLQNEGIGNSYVSKKTKTYFEISGTPGLRVAWELKGKQYDLPNIRQEDLEQQIAQNDATNDFDYTKEAFDSVMEYLNGGTL